MKFFQFIFIITFCPCIICSCATPDASVQNRQFEAQRNLGEAYLQEGNTSAALRELLKAEALNPNDPYLHNSLGIVYAANNRLDQAIEHYQKALALKPDYAPARNNLGGVYLRQEKWDAAIDCWTALTGDLVYATPHFPLYNIGWAYYNKKDYSTAETYFKQALDKEIEFARAYWGLGLVFMATGRTEAALAQFENAVHKEPRFARAYLDLGTAYRQTGKKEKAVEAFQKALELAPSSEIGKTAKEALAAMK